MFYLIIYTFVRFIYIRWSKVGACSRGRPESSLFNSYYTEVLWKALLFPGLFHYTRDTYLIMLSVNQGGINYHYRVFGMTRPRFELRSHKLLSNTLATRSMDRLLGNIIPLPLNKIPMFYVCTFWAGSTVDTHFDDICTNWTVHVIIYFYSFI